MFIQEDIQLKVDALSSERHDSFKFKLMKDIGIKWVTMDAQAERRDRDLVNKLQIFDDKIANLKAVTIANCL